MRTILTKHLNKLEALELSVKDYKAKIKQTEEEVVNINKAHQIMQKSAKMSQDHLAVHLSSIVTQAIQPVVNKPYEFVCEFVERRGSTEADLYLTKNGEVFDILSGTGGGLADVCSFSLKVAYLLLSNVNRVLIIDEVSRHINSPQQRTRFAAVLKKLSEEFEIQMIINSTIPELTSIADKLITLDYVNEETVIMEELNAL